MYKNKMKQKEFKRILNEVANLDVFGYEGILNMLSIHFHEQARLDAELGMKHSAVRDEERANYIFNELAKIGYYEL